MHFFLGRTTNSELFFIAFPGVVKKISPSKDSLFYLNLKKTLVIVAIKSVLRQRCIYNNQLWGCVIQYKALSCESK